MLQCEFQCYNKEGRYPMTIFFFSLLLLIVIEEQVECLSNTCPMFIEFASQNTFSVPKHSSHKFFVVKCLFELYWFAGFTMHPLFGLLLNVFMPVNIFNTHHAQILMQPCFSYNIIQR